jgi:hypothetical protein
MTVGDGPRRPAATLRNALAQAHVEAASSLFARVENWQLEEDVLCTLATSLPSNCDPAHVLPKAATLNSLYATNVFAITDMARHIATIFGDSRRRSRVELVSSIACLPLDGKTRHFRSFASKYCHFFVDAEAFPIMDSYAQRALTHHLDTKIADYGTWLNAIEELRQAANLCSSYRELDHYLWLLGQWLRHTEDPDAHLNSHAKRLFGDPAAASLVRQAFDT